MRHAPQDEYEYRYHPLCSYCLGNTKHTPEEHISSMTNNVFPKLQVELALEKEWEISDEEMYGPLIPINNWKT